MDQQISFIEKQFPVSKVSKESFKERKAVAGQTLTGLGKWWGRKPLILVRAATLGCLMPVSENPQKDMEIFLKLLSMDNDGLLDRKNKRIPIKELYALVEKHPYYKQFIQDWFEQNGDKIRIKQGQDRNAIEIELFKMLSYDEKLRYCLRPEQLDNLREDSWNAINHHLGTSAKTLVELVEQLSKKRYGKRIKVGDCFSGGGSIPFEVARIGAEAYGSDLNPIAGILTWASVNLLSLQDEELEAILSFRKTVFDNVDKEITDLGIEHNERGDRGIYYIYCTEVCCPECGKKIPLVPSWIIGKDTNTIGVLHERQNGFDIEIKMGADFSEMKKASSGTYASENLVCPSCRKTTPITSLRGDRMGSGGQPIYGLRSWEKSDFYPRSDDVFQERLYCIKYETPDGKRYYRSPVERDHLNEAKILAIVGKNLESWQVKKLLPASEIESGYNTDQVIRERGWTHWHHLFNPRQLLMAQILMNEILNTRDDLLKKVGLLGFNKAIDWNSKLSRWNSGKGNEKTEQTFYNQAFNTLLNWGARGLYGIRPSWFYNIRRTAIDATFSTITTIDARDIDTYCDYWITDPPYADAVNYHELTEFFLAWDKKLLEDTFPSWYADSKRVLAVRGDESFSRSMIDIYTNLTKHMPDNGIQIVMFTHSDPAVWAQLALIMWKSGLKVTAAWNIATETDASGLKDGNYVKGTVLLVLRKQTKDEIVFLDELNTDIRSEVRNQIASMMELDDKEESNFSDPDYVLAAYAASLKVLTQYKSIEDLNLDYELNLAINDPGRSKIVQIIENAKRIAYDCVVPSDFEGHYWRDLTNAEKFYIKGLESEKNGNYQVSTYQEFARGFNIGGYAQLMQSTRANSARLKTPLEIDSRSMNDIPGFENSLMKTIFTGIYAGVEEGENPMKALGFIKNELPDYWGKRDMIMRLLHFIKDIKDIDNMTTHWSRSAGMAEMLYSLVANDSV